MLETIEQDFHVLLLGFLLLFCNIVALPIPLAYVFKQLFAGLKPDPFRPCWSGVECHVGRTFFGRVGSVGGLSFRGRSSFTLPSRFTSWNVSRGPGRRRFTTFIIPIKRGKSVFTFILDNIFSRHTSTTWPGSQTLRSVQLAWGRSCSVQTRLSSG